VRLVFGTQVRSEAKLHLNDADNIWGDAWHAWRTGDGFALEYQTGDLGGRERRFVISTEQFKQLRRDPMAFETIVRAHGG
jgi:hypothetical protein